MVGKCTDRLISVLDTRTHEREFDVRETLKRYSMDVIWNCAFGFDIDIQQKDDDLDYFLKSEDVFKKTESLNIFSFISCKKKNEKNKQKRSG